MNDSRKKIAVLASHEGSLFQYLADACRRGLPEAEITVLISNNSHSGAVTRARNMKIPTIHLSGKTHPDPDQLDSALLDVLTSHQVDLVVLAGYMKKLGSRVLRQFEGRILNTHPALLPLFGGRGMYGRRVHEAVLRSGARESGASVHQVIAEYDSGPVLAQTRVPVWPEDRVEDLEERVKAAERELLLETVVNVLKAAR